MTKHEAEPEFSSAATQPEKKSVSGPPPGAAAAGARIVPTNGPVDGSGDTGVPGADAVVPVVRPEQDFFVEFGLLGFVLAWLGIYGLHVVCAAYFVAGGWLYHMLPPTRLAGNLKLYSLIISANYFSTVSVIHYIVAAAHCRFLVMPGVRYLYHNLTSAEMQRRLKKLRRRVSKQVKSRVGNVAHRLERSRSSRIVASGAKSIATYAYALLFARNGFFGVEGNYFETIFLLRELFETSLQAYQAYMMSSLLPRRVLNRFYVAVLIINCWSTPLLSHFVKHKPLQRLLCMLSDILLDFISSVFVPVYLALSYISDYDSVRTDFPQAFWYNDKWLVNVMNESPIILFGSFIDALSRLLFSISLLASMEDVKALVRLRRSRQDQYKAQKAASSALTTATTANSAVQSLTTKSATGSRAKALLLKGTIQRERILLWGHRIMTAFGVIVVILQIQAETKSDTQACVMELRPWLMSERACALVEMNCHLDKSLTGNMSNFERTFGDLHPSSLEHVVYRHCPQVEFGPRFAKFKNLIGLKVYNSSITHWDDDAALTQARHPNLRFAFYVFTNFTNGELPAGLLSPQFPRELLDNEYIATNLRGLPSDIATRWPLNLNLLLERGLLTRIPDEIATLRVAGVSMSGNQITDLTQSILDSKGIRTVALSGNPIEKLSDSLNGTKCTIKKLYFDATKLTALPEWMDDAFVTRTIVYAGRTPLCRDVLLQPNATAAKELLARRPYLSKVMCTDLGYDRTSFYPLATEIRADEVW